MATRDQSITLTEDEKARLNDVAVEAFGTTDVPFGAVVSMLTSNYLESEE